MGDIHSSPIKDLGLPSRFSAGSTQVSATQFIADF